MVSDDGLCYAKYMPEGEVLHDKIQIIVWESIGPNARKSNWIKELKFPSVRGILPMLVFDLRVRMA